MTQPLLQGIYLTIAAPLSVKKNKSNSHHQQTVAEIKSRGQQSGCGSGWVFGFRFWVLSLGSGV